MKILKSSKKIILKQFEIFFTFKSNVLSGEDWKNDLFGNFDRYNFSAEFLTSKR